MAVFSLLKTVNLCILIFYMFHWQGAKAVTTTTAPDLCDGGFDPFPQEDKRSIFYNETTTINDRYLRPGWYGRKGFQLSTTQPDFSHCGTRYPIYQQGELDRLNADVQSVMVHTRRHGGSCLDTWNIEAKICSPELTIYNLKRSTVNQSAYCLEKTNGQEYPDFRASTYVSVSLEKVNIQSYQYRYSCGFYTNSETELYFQTIWYVNGVEITKSDFLSYDNITVDSSITDEDLRDSGIKTVGFTISCGIRASFSNESEAGLESNGEGRFVGIRVGSWYIQYTPVINEGEMSNITIQLTDRIGFVFNDTRLGLTLQTPHRSSPCGMSVASDSHCGVELQPNRTWGYNLRIRGTLTERYGNDVQMFRLFLKTAPIYAEHRIWGNYSLSFDVYVKKNTSKIEHGDCILYSGTRLLTFTGSIYLMQLRGIFTLYKSLNYPIEVQVQTFRCDNIYSAYCVCGVVVRVGKTAFMINICHIENRFDVPEFIDYPVCGDGPDVIRVTKSGTQYKMELPNQGTVLVYIDSGYINGTERIKWLNVYIYPTILDVGASRGLCGNLTDKDEEEKVLRNGTTTSDNDTFFMSWRVPQGENLFDTSVLDNLDNIQGEYAELSYQTCSCTVPLIQGVSRNHIDCRQTNSYNCTEDPGRLVSNKRCRLPTRRRRSLPSFFVGDNFPRRRRRNVGEETGWTEGKTEEYCKNLFDSANIVERCKDIPGVDLSTALNSCMEDIQLTGSTMFALSTLDTIRSKCLYEATMNVTLQEETLEKPSVLQSVKEVGCIYECSYNGQCRTGESYKLTGSSPHGMEGGAFRFLCKIPDGAGFPVYLMFRKDGIETCRVDPDDCTGSPVNNNNQYKCGCINNNNRLYYMNISSLTSSHHGNWTCTNFNMARGSSNNISLPVYTLPTITNIQSNTNNNQTNEGSRVVFSCSVDGLPVPNVTWSTSKGGQLSSSKDYTVPEARCEDTDNYTCRASNGVGSPVSTTLPLYVTCSPREKSPPVTKVRNRINSTVTLEVDIIAFPKPEFTWRFEERNETLTDEVEEIYLFNYRSYLKLKLDESMFGNYTVVVGNSVGVPVHFTFTVSEVTDDGNFTVIDNEKKNKGEDESSTWILTGAVVAVVVAIIVVVLLVVYSIRRRRKKDTNENSPMVNGNSSLENETDVNVNDVVVNVNLSYEDNEILPVSRASGIFSPQVSADIYSESTKKKTKDKRRPMRPTFNKEGLNYADVALDVQTPTKKPRKRPEEEVEYAGIQYGVRGPTPPPVSDSDEEDGEP